MIGDRVAGLLGVGVRDVRPLGRQHRWGTYRATLADGREVFVKAADAPLGGLLPAEKRGLHWLRAAGTPVPEVLGCDQSTLVLSWLQVGDPDPGAAERFGRDLAALHASGAERFGAPWAGYIASLPLDNTMADTWPSWYASRRIAPFLRRGTDSGALSAADARVIETVMARIGDLAGTAEPPARIHGDCWSGNVIWARGRGWLVDPAAHGGHRETDLAMLALFGAPYLDRIVAAYAEATPLAAGWRSRVPLHQLHPLLVHVCLFGAGYRAAAVEAARAALAAG
ncbi:MAG TPA: fructosamine kinase family protein [Streptosporangiaceae bacterium]|nr:fructosamine kinase family protein [Streptosporangiaceae bacterium]